MKVGFVVGLPQDADLVLPFAEFMKSKGFSPFAIVRKEVAEGSPRVISWLTRTEIPFKRFSLDELGSSALRGAMSEMSALVAGADTNLKSHEFAFGVVSAGNDLGLQTYSMQHGLENVGLTYDDGGEATPEIAFAAKHVFVWSSNPAEYDKASPETLKKLVFTGFPKSSLQHEKPLTIQELRGGYEKLIGIFENLHWNRYSTAHTREFIESVSLVAHSFPESLFLVVPHRVGNWSGQFQFLFEELKMPNIRVLNPKDPRWEPLTASAIVPLLDAVVTTPSTVALDAAWEDVPVAVACWNLDIKYFPLPKLRSRNDWVSFLHALLESPESIREQSRKFVATFRSDQPPLARMLQRLEADVSGLPTRDEGWTLPSQAMTEGSQGWECLPTCSELEGEPAGLIQLFLAGKGEFFGGCRAFTRPCGRGLVAHVFEIEDARDEAFELRLDPFDGPALVRVHRILVEDRDGRSRDLAKSGEFSGNWNWRNGPVLFFDHNDPQILLGAHRVSRITVIVDLVSTRSECSEEEWRTWSRPS